MSIEWHKLHPSADHYVGSLYDWISEKSPDSIVKQINDHYSYGGGWHNFTGFTVEDDGMTLAYPDDPPMHALAWARLREERVFVFPYSWVLVLNDNGRADVARVD